MGRKSSYTEAQEASLRSLREDHPDETYIKVATRAYEYGMCEGKTIYQIADKLSRMYLTERKAIKKAIEVMRSQGATLIPYRTTPEGPYPTTPESETQMPISIDPSANTLDRIATTLERIEAILNTIKEEKDK